MTTLNSENSAQAHSSVPVSESHRGKRAFDLLAAGSALMLFAPVGLAISLAIVFEDGGPALYFQPRAGRQRRPFEIVKFRSMRDHQVTRVGSWLRRTGLDELPQFVNVWHGDMSVVGPRPLTTPDIDRLGWDQPTMSWRFAERPGITGLSQLFAGHGARASRRLDRLYLRRQSPLLDMKLIALSLIANIVGKRSVRRLRR
jgi:lipopolysaccharide/colanic/teichoic acid biosynthesis glycosyltransferase